MYNLCSIRITPVNLLNYCSYYRHLLNFVEILFKFSLKNGVLLILSSMAGRRGVNLKIESELLQLFWFAIQPYESRRVTFRESFQHLRRNAVWFWVKIKAVTINYYGHYFIFSRSKILNHPLCYKPLGTKICSKFCQ